MITGNRDIGGLRSPHSEGLGRKSRKTRPPVAWGGPYGYDFARNWGSSGECQLILHGSIGAGNNVNEVAALAKFRASPGMVDKGLAEKTVIDSGVAYTIIRNGLVPLDPQPPATEHAFLTTDHTAWGEVTRDDLAILTLDVMDNPARLNKVYHAVDPTLKLRGG